MGIILCCFLTLNIFGQNHAPTVIDSSYSISHGETMFYMSDEFVLDEDDDIDENSYKILSRSLKGTAYFENLRRWGSVMYYTPPRGSEALIDTVFYSVCDLTGLCDSGLLIINVAKNIPPHTEVMNWDSPFFSKDSGYVFNKYFMKDEDDGLDLNSFKIVKAPKYCDFTMDSSGYYKIFYITQDINDTIIYSICDKSALCTEGYIYISVTQNEAPIIYDLNFSRSKNSAIVENLGVYDPEFNLNTNALSILKNSKNGLFTWAFKEADQQLFMTYTPNKDFFGLDTINYKVCDTEGLCDSGFIYIEVINNNAPVAVDDIFRVKINGYIEGSTALNDFDIDYNINPHSYLLIKNTQNGYFQGTQEGTFFYRAKDILGRDTLTYSVCDDLGSCDTANLIFIVENADASLSSLKIINIETPKNTPLISNEILKPGGNIIQTSIIRAPKSGTATLDANTNLKYIPLSNFTGKDTLEVQVCTDLGECDTTIFYISVINSSTLAPFATDDYITLSSNNTVSGSALTNDTDNGSPIIQVLIVSNPQNGILNINNNGIFTYTPAKDFVGTDRADYGICNINGCDTASIYFTITPNVIQNKPIATNDYFTTLKNTSVTGSVATNDKDADNNIQINGFKLLKKPLNGTLTLNTNGNFTYLPSNNFIGVDTASYVVCDSTNLCDTAFIFFTVKDVPVKHAPVATDDYFSTNENEPLSNTVASNDFDVDNDLKISSFKVLKTTKKGVLILKEEGSFLYTATANFIGSDTASYTVCDTTGLCDTAFIFISVKKVYHKPTLVSEDFMTTFNTALKGNVALNDSDIDNDLNKESYIISQNPRNGSVKMWKDGKFLYLPKYNFAGIDTFLYEVCDSQRLCSKAMCIVTIRAGYLSGKIFVDDNGDGIFNANEKGVANVFVKINDKTEVFTNAQGDYQTLVDTSKSYQMTPVLNTKLFTLSPLSKAVFTGNTYNQRIDNQDFALKAISPINDLTVSVEQGNARPGFESITKLTYTNQGTSTLNGSLHIKLDDYLSLMGLDIDPTTINGNNMSWNFTNLRPFESRNITLTIKTSVNAPRSYSTKIDYNGILNGETDIDTSNNKGVSSMEVRGSFDPNDISVDIEKVIQKGTIRESVIPLTYTIRFQNTGNAEAYRVEVIDTLSEKLDITSLEMIASSHSFEMKIITDSTISNPVVKWIFNNINLTDSTTKEACSHGFIKYKINNIKNKTNYSKDSILNKAAIYFDFNEPVLTNTAMTQFSFSTPIKEIKNLSFQAYPNPTNDWVTIDLDKNVEAQIIVTNLLGQVLKQDILRGTNGQINLSGLMDGVYFITVKTEKEQGSIKVLKQ
jgi:Bacterial Ig domain/Secretion system C-terminal sorting domain